MEKHPLAINNNILQDQLENNLYFLYTLLILN